MANNSAEKALQHFEARGGTNGLEVDAWMAVRLHICAFILTAL